MKRTTRIGLAICMCTVLVLIAEVRLTAAHPDENIWIIGLALTSLLTGILLAIL